ncbi:Histone deacetylase HDT1 [Apostasia shenzhenica]|uniref:Histone deacetylase HDT1 n=1 Tax=Apostasia shenzhenica TaxID=1088818 RepID=A0A2I0AN99_9ASPA|nr:Histone deacetylase HDT1 [Apostasia shenzhenica]
MEFWGVEVKPGQTVKCGPGDEKLLHLSQASLGEVKKDKGSENVPIFVNINNQKLVIGNLSGDSCAQIQYDLVFEKDFELSHGSKSTSIFFVGYKSIHPGYGSEDDFDDSDSEDELQVDQKTNGKAVIKNEPSKPLNAVKPNVVKADGEPAKAKTQPGKPEKADKPKTEGKVEEDEDDDGDDDDDDDDDEKMGAAMLDNDDDEDDDEDDEDSDEDEDATPKAENEKKRPAAVAASKSPIPEKKAKLVTPAEKQKPGGGDGKKGGHVATPHPAKAAGKTPATGDKPKQQQTPKPAGSIVCKSCSKTFNSDNALQSHTKAKHGGAK